MNDLQIEATYWLSKKISIIPIIWKAKSPEEEWRGFADRLPTQDEIGRWFVTRLHNIAVVAGWQNLVIVDFDNWARYEEWLNWIMRQQYEIVKFAATTRIVKSARGAHVYALTRESAVNMKLEEVDILAQRKYALIPPSIHPSGSNYEFIRQTDPVRIKQIEDILPPKWLQTAQIEKAAEFSRILSENSAKADSSPLSQAGTDRQTMPSRSLIREIKNHYRIEDFFKDLYPSRDKHWLMVRCPFHDDKKPSMWIDPQRQICNCNACKFSRPLDVINLYAKLNGIDNREAVEQLAAKLSY